MAAGSCVACSDCCWGFRPLPVPGTAQLCHLQWQEPGLRPSWPAAAGSHGQQQDWVPAAPPQCYSCSTKREFPERVSEQIHPWDVSFGFGWAAPAGTPPHERLSRVSKLVSTSQLPYSSCAVLLIAKKWDCGSVALFLLVIIKVIITENCSRWKNLSAQTRSLNSSFSKLQNETFLLQFKASYTFRKAKCLHKGVAAARPIWLGKYNNFLVE